MYIKQKLPNGLKTVMIPMKGTNSVVVLLMVGVGSKYETREINGISHFAEHMFFQGTEKRPSSRLISEEIDAAGGDMNAFTSKEYTGYYVKMVAKKLELGLDIISDIFLNSKFREEDIERERRVILEEMKLYWDTPVRYINDRFEKLLYKDTPAGWDIVGTEKSLQNINRDYFLDYLQKRYNAQNSVLVVAGNLGEIKKDAKDQKYHHVFSLLLKYFSKISEGDLALKEKVVEKQEKPEVLLHFKETDQTHLALGVRGYDILDPKRYATALLSVILGGTMSSRMFVTIRDEKGLAYYVRTSQENYTDSGFLVTQVGVDNKRVEEAVAAIVGEYRKVLKKGVEKKELEKAREYVIGRLLLDLEGSDELASWVATQEVLEKEALTIDEKINEIRKVKIEDIERVSQEIFKNDKLNLAIIGPFKKENKFLDILKI
jgi:predicted Zn-dependent peptidase